MPLLAGPFLITSVVTLAAKAMLWSINHTTSKSISYLIVLPYYIPIDISFVYKDNLDMHTLVL